MIVIPKPALLVATGLFLTPVASQAQLKPADWHPVKFDPLVLAQGSEKMMRTFKNVAGYAAMKYRVKFPGDPKGYGSGNASLPSFFWSNGKFRVQYLVMPRVKLVPQKHKGSPPQKEWLATLPEFVVFDGTGKKYWLGDVEGGHNFTPQKAKFDVSSDADLVEQWPIHFNQYMYSSFVGGNATLTRYLSALKRGVGGFKLSVDWRKLPLGKGTIKQYRIHAARQGAKGRVPSDVEIIFDEMTPGKYFLPVTVNTLYGNPMPGAEKGLTPWEFHWTIQWSNNAAMPPSPLKIDQ